MFKLAEACRPLTSSRHGSVVVRRVPRSSRHSLLAPPARRQWYPKAPARLVEGMFFRTPRTVEDTFRLAYLPEGFHEGSSAQTPVIVSIPHCALRARAFSPLSKLVRSRTTRCFASSMRLGASGSGLSPGPRSPSPRCHSMEGRGKLDPLRLTAARTRRSRGSRSRASFAMGTANAEDPGRHRPMSATHDSVIKTGTLRPGTLHSVFPHLAVARAFTALQPASAFADASRGSVRPSQRFRAYRACFVTRGIPGRTRLVASTSVARGPRTPERVRAQGQPPDGLDLRHRIA